MDTNNIECNFGAKISVYYYFSLEGVIVAIWSAVNPTIKEKLHVTDGQFGSIILFFYLGGVIATALSGVLLRIFGSKWCTFISALIFTGSINLIILAPDVSWTIAAMYLFGSMYGCMDVCMNSCAVLTEFVANLPLLGKYHGSYAIASAAGASIASYCLGSANWTPRYLFIFFTILCTLLTIISSNYLYNYKEELEICEFEKYKELLNDDEDDEDDEDDDGDLAEDIAQLLSDNATLNDNTNANSSQLNSGNLNKCDSNTRYRNNKYRIPNAKDINSSLSESSLTSPLNPLFDNPNNNEYSPSHGSNDSSYLSFNRHRGDSETPSQIKTDDGIEYYNENDGFLHTFKRCFYLACVGFISSFGECSITTWVVIYYKRIIESSTVLETLGFTGFMICMAIGRFSSDYLRQQYGRRRLIFYSGILASTGLIIVVATPNISHFFLSKNTSYVVTFVTILSTFGFSITGLGLSSCVPTVFSTAGHLEGVHPGSAIALVAFFTYTGSIVSPAVVGYLSDLLGLRIAFLCESCLLFCITLFSYYIPYESNIKDNYKNSTECADNDVKLALP